MSTTTHPSAQPKSSFEAIDWAIGELAAASSSLASATVRERIELAEECVPRVLAVAEVWTHDAWQAKHLDEGDPARAEDLTTGPVAVIRYLKLLAASLRDIEQSGRPRLPGNPRRVAGQLRVPVFPTRQLYDRMLFYPLAAETWLDPAVEDDASLFNEQADEIAGRSPIQPGVAAVMGAGNVSAIPATDALTKIFQESRTVLLKMNPVNDYLGPIFNQALAPLVDRGWLRICYGGAAEGEHVVGEDRIGSVHVTGSIGTHDAIVWGSDDDRERRRAAGEPKVAKEVTSELGNVTPWTIVPGTYSKGELEAQAEHMAASIVNNASFNCIATKMIVTWRQWPERTRLLDAIEAVLGQTPQRFAYYPGARERYQRFAGGAAAESTGLTLPWTLLRDVSPVDQSHLFEEESFVCVCGETALDADSAEQFMERAAEFMNERLWGNLAAAVTVPGRMSVPLRAAVDKAIDALRFGTIGVNVWPGIAYALMSPPWGGFPGNPLADARSGIGAVHNTYFLNRPQKTVLRGPLKSTPKPVWFPSHRRPLAVAERLLALYADPAWWRLPPLFVNALRG